jgi:hypothetical protein
MSTKLKTKSTRIHKLNEGKKLGNQIHQLAYQKYSGTAQSGAMGRRRRDRNHSLQNKTKQNKIQYRIHWEMKKINTHFLTSKKTTINVTIHIMKLKQQ